MIARVPVFNHPDNVFLIDLLQVLLYDAIPVFTAIVHRYTNGRVNGFECVRMKANECE